MASIEIIGYLAGFTVAVSLFPQVVKAWRTKSTKDISVAWTLIYIIGLFLWIVYGAGIQSYPLIIFVSLEFLMALSLFILKIIYK